METRAARSAIVTRVNQPQSDICTGASDSWQARSVRSVCTYFGQADGETGANDVDLPQCGRENRPVSIFRVVAVVCALVAPVAAVSRDLIGIALSSRAEACCAAMGGECAGLSTPDVCCQTQRFAASPDLTSTAPSFAHVDVASPVSTPSICLSDGLGSSRVRLVRAAFKRPHDPPHLHGFPFLV